MNCYQLVENALKQTFSSLYPDTDLGNITVEPCKDPNHGDVATNAALVLAKPLKQNPRQIAETLKTELQSIDDLEAIEIAGPGFLNFRFTTIYWRRLLTNILEQGNQYGLNRLVNDQKINVEYVSANPTGPLHVGHARMSCFGDALANLLEVVGYNVTREYYVNDAGAQIAVLARSVYHRYQELLGQNPGKTPTDFYPADYVKDAAQVIIDEDNDKWLHTTDWLGHFKKRSIELMLDLIKNDLKQLNIEHDVFTSEDSLSAKQPLEILEQKELLYKGSLPPPKGKPVENWQAEEQLLFKSQQFGDDEDRAVQKSDGTNTYFAGDIAYHYDKLQRGFDKMIVALGADHGGYVKRLKAIVAALSDNKAEIDVKLCQLVQLKENGKPFKMSKRAGTFVTVRDVVDLVGADSLRFIMLTRRNDATLEVDIALLKEQRRENPVFYVQYAHARICSVQRHVKEQNLNVTDDFDPQYIEHDAEFKIIKTLANWPRQVRLAATHHEPHRIAFYLISLAEDFHSLWNQGNKNANLRFIDPQDLAKTSLRLALLRAVQQTLQNGLKILGVQAVEEM